MKLLVCLMLLAALAAGVRGQAIRSYAANEMYPGQICADDGSPSWEPYSIVQCPQGYHGIRNWAKANNRSANGVNWPPCNPCGAAQKCLQFKPGVAKCVVKADKKHNRWFLKPGEKCLDFENGKGKWHPVNKDLFGKMCAWPQYSCNAAKGKLDLYTCQRVRNSRGQPATTCYRAAGSRWWGGTDQVYYYHNATNQFKPCGGPTPEYPSCTKVAPHCKKILGPTAYTI
jgi:hypothetical protein